MISFYKEDFVEVGITAQDVIDVGNQNANVEEVTSHNSK